MSVVGAGVMLGAALTDDTPARIDRLSFPWMLGAWSLGSLLSMVAGQLASLSSMSVAEYRRGRLWRWLGSDQATFVDLSGRASQRAKRAAEAKDSRQPPNASVVAMPLLMILGALCFGFGGVMALVPPPFAVGLSGRAYSVFWGLTLLLMLSMSLWRTGRSTIWVFGWANERAAAAARAQADAERARLAALQAQMNPHFLFNTLNTVAALASPDSPRAERVVEHLSAVLRHSLQRADQPFTSLEDELRFVREYLEVEHIRLGPRLRVSWNIHDDTRPLRVPTMCVLSLVESAIAQSVEARAAGGHVEIASALTADGSLLSLSVEEYGPGDPPAMKDRRTLEDLRQRLDAEYGHTYALDAEPIATGTRVTMSVPATAFEAQPADRSPEMSA
jgi:Histidine kinase